MLPGTPQLMDLITVTVTLGNPSSPTVVTTMRLLLFVTMELEFSERIYTAGGEFLFFEKSYNLFFVACTADVQYCLENSHGN